VTESFVVGFSWQHCS